MERAEARVSVVNVPSGGPVVDGMQTKAGDGGHRHPPPDQPTFPRTLPRTSPRQDLTQSSSVLFGA